MAYIILNNWMVLNNTYNCIKQHFQNFLMFFNKEKKSEKKMMIFAKGVLLGYEVWIFNKNLQEINLPFPVKAMKRTLDEIDILIQHISSLRICYGQSTIGL